MKKELSLYLDLTRVFAAFVVFVGHLSWARLSGGALWWMQPYGHDGVIVFFVLSGFVIQYVAVQKEKTFYDYSIARFARLYSVLLPALLLTVFCDSIGSKVNASVYLMDRESNPLLRCLASGLFLTQSWGWNLSMLSNDAFWSLPYEFWYYQIFGAVIFLRGAQRMFWIAISALIAGPVILIYFPIWLFGAAAYLASKKINLTERKAWTVFLITCLGIVGVMILEGRGIIHRSTLPYLPPGFAAFDFVTGALVAANLFSASFISLPLKRAAGPITFFAGFSFALYLFHLPLLHIAAAIVPVQWPANLKGLIIGGFTLITVYLLGFITERKKKKFAEGLILISTWVSRTLVASRFGKS
ncbi:MAG TPA: acyltransferase [Burkholderiaceae bacterium]|jgi:peptidoglycan/LPS O-acetylase OafA/YrhL